MLPAIVAASLVVGLVSGTRGAARPRLVAVVMVVAASSGVMVVGAEHRLSTALAGGGLAVANALAGLMIGMGLHRAATIAGRRRVARARSSEWC
jgi:hypothetical protein